MYLIFCQFLIFSVDFGNFIKFTNNHIKIALTLLVISRTDSWTVSVKKFLLRSTDDSSIVLLRVDVTFVKGEFWVFKILFLFITKSWMWFVENKFENSDVVAGLFCYSFFLILTILVILRRTLLAITHSNNRFVEICLILVLLVEEHVHRVVERLVFLFVQVQAPALGWIF